MTQKYRLDTLSRIAGIPLDVLIQMTGTPGSEVDILSVDEQQLAQLLSTIKAAADRGNPDRWGDIKAFIVYAPSVSERLFRHRERKYVRTS